MYSPVWFSVLVGPFSLDHLDGKLFVDYVSELKRTRIRKKLEKEKRTRPAANARVGSPAN